MTSPLLTYKECSNLAFEHQGFKDCKHCQEHVAHTQLVKVVAWLEEHNPCRHHRDNEPEALSNKSLYLTPEDWQSLKELVK